MTDRHEVEAVLFASGRYLPADEIGDLAGVSADDVRSIIDDINDHYDDIDSALRIFEENDKYKMNVTEDYSYVVRKVVSEAELDDALMETLALIAYKAPVLQSDIIEARSARAYDHIHRLCDRGFIEREREGRTYTLHVTDKFYSYFDVQDRNELSRTFEAVQPPDVDVTLKDDEDQDGTEQFEDFLSTRLRDVEERDEDAEKAFLEDIDERLERVKEDVDEIKTDVEPPEAHDDQEDGEDDSAD